MIILDALQYNSGKSLLSTVQESRTVVKAGQGSGNRYNKDSGLSSVDETEPLSLEYVPDTTKGQL
jgi:hypothetical protein